MLFELFSQPGLASSVGQNYDLVSSVVHFASEQAPREDAGAWLLCVQAPQPSHVPRFLSMNPPQGQSSERVHPCRFNRLVQDPGFAVALGRRNQVRSSHTTIRCSFAEADARCLQELISPKKTAALTVLMEQAQGDIADEAASLMYTLERVIAEDDFRKSHERAMQNRSRRKPHPA
eukprot:475897-Rhodomonas_salina.4